MVEFESFTAKHSQEENFFIDFEVFVLDGLKIEGLNIESLKIEGLSFILYNFESNLTSIFVQNFLKF
jgi:hypothetical protein